MLPVVPFLILLGHLPAAAPAASPGEAVVRSAYAMYAKTWYKNAQWVQRTTQQGAQQLETWYVSMQPPGLLRADVAPGVTGRAFIYRADSLYQFGHGQLRTSTASVEPLFVLLHDLHSAPPEKTIRMLKTFGFDLARTHEATWNGTRVIVVGASASDSSSNQFWLEKRRMILVRLIERNGQDPRRPLDAQIFGYEKAGGGWLEREVRVFLGREPTMLEEYTDVVVDAKLEPDLFEPVPYHLPQWVHGASDIFGRVPNMALPGGH